MKQILHFTKLTCLLIFLGLGSTIYSQDAPFIKIEQPNEAGIFWEIGSHKLIVWNSNFTKPVKISLVDYTDIGNPVVELIADNVVGSTYSWHIDPNEFTPGDNYKIRVASTVNDSYKAESENNFSLVLSHPDTYVKVEQPNEAGITWVAGETYLISWEKEIPGKFTIELVDNSDNSVEYIIATNVAGSTFYWTIDGATPLKDTYRIRVISEVDPDKKDISDNDFTISNAPGDAEIAVLQPSDNGITWVKGETYLISWLDNLPGKVDIELISEDPIFFDQEVAFDKGENYNGNWTDGSNQGFGFKPWEFIATAGDGLINLIADPSVGEIVGMEAESFAQSIDGVIGGDVFAVRDFDQPLEIGQTFSVDWAVNKFNEGYQWFSLKYDDNSLLWFGPALMDNNVIEFYWTNNLNPEPIFQNHGTNVMRFSFTLKENNKIQVKANGRDGVEMLDKEYEIGNTPYGVYFNVNAFQNLDDPKEYNYFNNLKITQNEYDYSIAQDVGGSTYAWTIPNNLPSGTKYKIRISDSETNTIIGESEFPFSILNYSPDHFIKIDQPNTANLEWVRGTSYLISWLDNIPSKATIFITDANGNNGQQLATNVEGTTWPWAIPANFPTGDYKIKIVKSGLTKIAENAFSIISHPAGGIININQPTVANLVWLRGQPYYIAWDPSFQTGPVKIILMKGGVEVQELKDNYEGSTWVWTIPANIAKGNDYKIKVQTIDGTVSGESLNNFSIDDTPGGSIEVLQPNGGEILFKGTQYLISWIDDIPEPVKIVLYKDDVGYRDLANNVIGSTWVWDIANDIINSDKYTIKIRSIHSNNINDFSDNYFTIIDQVLFSFYPNPAKDYITVNLNDKVSDHFVVQLKDKLNTIHFEQKIEAFSGNELRISTANLPTGVYFLTVTSTHSKETQKILIQR
ncbi:MAG: Ser-Thr-rich GPI-anchored membrane family protein [Bacteroidales bacterium]|jgi:hypothetical protein|nr:T9SS type A sorting domain-containing protein [Bacteroidales bacterium]MDD3700281.1 T9SS type A sorting domain-containing protein [Bacteroidales bacterium]MDY0368511.1 T9SS type A sorting domain-containing protein [Bacteroidales bacterium]